MRMASGVVAVAVLAGCGASALELRREACERADPEACYDTARDAAAHGELEITRDELARQKGAFDASTCLAQHPVAACFHAVLVVMRQPARGVLADYAVPANVLAVLPEYTGAEATGPLATARDALAAMCSHPGDPVGRARACIALGDLVTVERAKQIAGFDRAPDGYETACNLSVPDPLVRATYHTDACGIVTSPLRGSSVFEGRENLERIAQDAAMRAQAEADAAKREADRVAEVQAQERADREAAKRASDTERLNTITRAAAAADWAAILVALQVQQPLDPPTADTLASVFPAFSTWLIAQSSVIGAQLELDRDLGTVEPDTALAGALADLRVRAIAAAKNQAGVGPGGRFVHAALRASVSRDAKDLAAARIAYDALVVAARATLVIDQLPPACAPLARTVPGHPLHATAKLTCEIQPEHAWIEKTSVRDPGEHGGMLEGTVPHRGWRLSIHGELRTPRDIVPIDIADSDDETKDGDAMDGPLDRPLALVLTGIIDSIWKELIAPADAATASAALAAGRAALAHHDMRRAENELAIHAVLAGASEELDQLLAPDRVTFGQLLPPAATK